MSDNNILSKAAIKALFQSGDVPIGQNFADWIWTMKAYEAPIVLPFSQEVQPDCNDGLVRKVTLTGDIAFDAPINAVEGINWECWVTCDGTPRNLAFDGAILIPSDSAFTSPKTLTINKTYIILMKYNGTAWMLVSLVGGF